MEYASKVFEGNSKNVRKAEQTISLRLNKDGDNKYRNMDNDNNITNA